MQTRITLKKNSESGKVPLPAELFEGEVALNTADGLAYTKLTNGQVVQMNRLGNPSLNEAYQAGREINLNKGPIVINNSETDNIFSINDFSIYVGSVDPTIVARNATIGSIYFRTDTADIYQKLDNGLTTNWLSVKTAESNMMPTSAIIYLPTSTTPTGYLKANGAELSRSVYNRLFGLIGTTFGAGDGVNTFNIPDARGVFIRGLDDGRGIDIDRVLSAILQSSANLNHLHSINPPSTTTTTTSIAHGHTFSAGFTTTTNGNHGHSINDPGHGHSSTTTVGVYVGSSEHDNQDSSWPRYGNGTVSISASSTGISIVANGDHAHTGTVSGTTGTTDVVHGHTVDIPEFNSGSTGGIEARPINIALVAYIKY